MIRLAILLATCLTLAAQEPFPVGFFVNPVVAAAASCATSDTSIAHDEALEGWEGDGTELTWTEIESADTGTLTPGFDSSALSTGKVSGQCNKALQVDCNATTAGYNLLYWNRGSIIGVTTAADFNFYIYVTTLPDDGERIGPFVFGENSNPDAAQLGILQLINNSGTMQIRVSSATDSAYVSLTGSSWNKVTVHFDATAALSSIAVNDGTPQTFTRSATRGIQYVFAGVYEKAAGEACVYVIDLVCLNTP